MPYHTNTAKPKIKKKTIKKKKPKKKKVVMKTRMGLSQNQRDKLKEHAIHHTSQHMAIMIKEMKGGSSFTKAHNKAKKMVGK